MFIGYQARRDCEGRYAALKSTFDIFHRPFSLIDLGAGEGYFAERVVAEYQQTAAVLVEGESLYSGQLPWIKRHLSAYEINEYAKGEHFDVVLCLSMLHHVKDWRGFLQGVFALGEHIIIEYPTPADKRCFERPGVSEQYEFLSAMRYDRDLGKFTSFHGFRDGRQMVYFYNPKLCVSNDAFYYEREIRRPVRAKTTRISASLEYKKVGLGGDFVYGTNLFSYINLGGQFRDEIIAELPFRQHGDLKPWNYVLQSNLHAIPIDYEPWRGLDDERAYRELIHWLRNGGRLC